MPHSKTHSKLDRVAYLEQLLDEVHGDIDAAREDGVPTAVSRLTATALQIRNELDAARPPKKGLPEMTGAELAARLARAISQLSKDDLGPIEEALAERRVH